MVKRREARLQRARKTRAKIVELKSPRLCVYRSNSHIYVQIIDGNGAKILASASTAEPEVRKDVAHGGNVKAAVVVGKRIADKAKTLGIRELAFDRSGFRYHGRVKALADAAREAGLVF
jgi:large subunit ribosomal protein L18